MDFFGVEPPTTLAWRFSVTVRLSLPHISALASARGCARISEIDTPSERTLLSCSSLDLSSIAYADFNYAEGMERTKHVLIETLPLLNERVHPIWSKVAGVLCCFFEIGTSVTNPPSGPPIRKCARKDLPSAVNAPCCEGFAPEIAKV